jgi:hypothetical protein
MTVIGTISSLAFVPDFEEYRRPMYDTLNPDPRAAIASYLEALPDMVALRDEDRLGVARSLDRYWAQFIREAPQRIDTAHN